MESDGRSQPYNRRRFLEHFTALGVASVFPAMVSNPVPAGAVLPTERLPFVHCRPQDF
ncbi:MAG: hypothetical protein WBC70_15285 [Candidatus Aminicenantales bacterium]